MMFVMGEAIFFPNMEHRENIEYEEKLGLFFIPIFVTDFFDVMNIY